MHHLHFHKKSHNQLNSDTILYDKHGNIVINMLLSSSSRPKEKSLHWHSPESLQPKAGRSLKNDIWALGCLAIAMLTSDNLKSSELHPYNWNNFKDQRENTMIENIRQRYQDYFGKEKRKSKREKVEVSAEALSFIRSCLAVLESDRPETQSLL